MKLFGTDGIRARPGTRRSIRRRWHAWARRWSGRCRSPAASGRACSSAATRASRASGLKPSSRAVSSGEGAQAVSVGVIPTPGVAYLTRTEGFDAGIVISASHNPYEDNGIKMFSGRGEKLDAAFESAIERLVADGSWQVVGDAGATLDARSGARTALRRTSARDSSAPPARSPGARDRHRLRQRRDDRSSRRALFERLGFDATSSAISPTAATSTATAARRISICCRSEVVDARRAPRRRLRRRRRSRALRRSARAGSSTATRCC